MGYNTNYTLTVQVMVGDNPVVLVDDTPIKRLIAKLRDQNEEAECSLSPNGTPSGNDSRWHEHQEDMKKFSREHSNILFTLHGEGEENTDLWNKYFLNGKCQEAKAQFIITPFDPKELR